MDDDYLVECACSHVLDEHDVSGGLACMVDGCPCPYFEAAEGED